MRLKRLELLGYKSFANKTEFVFNGGVTAIVGPNGSGKSNIADALRWALGEQSYRSLRGKRGEDMIFAGSDGHTRLGMAQVSVTLENGTGPLNSPTHDHSPTLDPDSPIGLLIGANPAEVTITRRAYRSGENEYLINGARVRLRDVAELLAYLGINHNTYAVIGQGMVDAALALRAEERRELLDEAAGLRPYQSKRESALNRLSETEANLVRVQDIVAELEPQLKRLERQATRAREHARITEELRTRLTTWYGYQWHRAQEDLRLARARVAEIESELAQYRAAIRSLDHRLAELDARREACQQAIQAWQAEIAQLRTQREATQRDLAVARERAGLLATQRDELMREVESLATQVAAQEMRLRETQADVDRLTHTYAARQIETQALRDKAQASEQERLAVMQQLQATQEAVLALTARQVDRRSRLTQLAERDAAVAQEIEARRNTLAGHEQRLAELAAQIETAERESAELAATIMDLARQIEERRHAAAEVRSQQAQTETRLHEARHALARLTARRDALARMRERLTGYTGGVQAILDRRQDLPGLISPVAGLLHVPPDLEAAIEAALGGQIQALVVERWTDAERGVKLLRERGAGRATFLPLDTLKAGKVARGFPVVEGVIGVAADLVSVEERCIEVVRSLLGNTVVVQDLPAAHALLSRLRTQGTFGVGRIVTLKGDLVALSGAVTGGAARHDGGLLTQEREWRELPAQIDTARRTTQALDTRRQQQIAEITRIERAITRLEAQREQLLAAQRAQHAALEGLRRQQERLSQEAEWIRSLVEQQAHERASLAAETVTLRRDLDLAETEHAALLTRVESLQAQVNALSGETIRRALAAAETAEAVAARDVAARQSLQRDQETTLLHLRDQVGAKRERMARMRAEIATLAEHIEAWANREAALESALAALQAQIDPARADLETMARQRQALEADRVRNRDRLHATEVAHSQAVAAAQRWEDRLRHLRDEIAGDPSTGSGQALGLATQQDGQPLQLTLELPDGMVPLPAVTVVPEGLAGEVEMLKRQLRALGSVDPEALAEYETLRARHEFLTTQAADLRAALEDLRRVVAELDKVMADRFQSTFTRVATIFERNFTTLFGGGSARLTLIEAENPSQTGIEIVARPPGKRMQSLASLSGGERALTAVALIFALLEVSGTPFCLLDEVDAMLDEANVGRFREALERLAAQTQFILITHNRGTIQVASTIYGVTMGDVGVSKVISLQLDEVKSPQTSPRHLRPRAVQGK